jgi:ATP-dependent Zn protease
LGYEMTQGRDYSEATAALIDNDVHRLLAEQYDGVVELLQARRELLDRLVQKLLQEETVDQEALTDLLGARAQGMFEDLLGERPTDAISAPQGQLTPQPR